MKLRDFIYLDTERVRSFVAQLRRGIPETTGHSTDKHASGGGAANLGIAEVKGEVLYVRSDSETRSVHHYLYSLLEDELVAQKKVLRLERRSERSSLDRTPDGGLLLLRSSVTLIDYKGLSEKIRIVGEIIPLVSRLSSVTASPSQARDRNKAAPSLPEKKTFQDITKFIDQLYPDIIRVKASVSLDRGDVVLVGSAIPRFFPDFQMDRGSLLHQYGLVSPEDWYILCQLNRPSFEVTSQSNQNEQDLDTAIITMLSAMQGVWNLAMPVHAGQLSMTPIAIYREI